jgi:hypothetical protein
VGRRWCFGCCRCCSGGVVVIAAAAGVAATWPTRRAGVAARLLSLKCRSNVLWLAVAAQYVTCQVGADAINVPSSVFQHIVNYSREVETPDQYYELIIITFKQTVLGSNTLSFEK